MIITRALTLLLSLASWAAVAQDNSFALTIQNGAMWQANLTKQMINLGGTPTTGGGSSPASCMPPFDLQRGVDGHVPPELQGDPRYQEYLRCKQGASAPGSAPAQGPGMATPASPPATAHLPISASDFIPAKPGYPSIDQAISNMDATPAQRQQLHEMVDEMFRRVGSQYRANNLAVSAAVAYATSMTTLNGSDMNKNQSWEFIYRINDQLAQNPKFAQLSAREKQDESDKFIFQSAVISALRDEAASSPQAKQQAQELSHVVLRQFDGESSPGVSQHKLALGLKLGPLTPAVAAAAGFRGDGGAFVVAVAHGSPAERAGFKAGDILVHLGDHDIKTALDAQTTVAEATPGQVIPARVIRQGVQSELSVTF